MTNAAPFAPPIFKAASPPFPSFSLSQSFLSPVRYLFISHLLFPLPFPFPLSRIVFVPLSDCPLIWSNLCKCALHTTTTLILLSIRSVYFSVFLSIKTLNSIVFFNVLHLHSLKAPLYLFIQEEQYFWHLAMKRVSQTRTHTLVCCSRYWFLSIDSLSLLTSSHFLLFRFCSPLVVVLLYLQSPPLRVSLFSLFSLLPLN